MISVIIPAYNAGRTIGRAIRSVLSQTGVDAEIIVVDDASSDDTSATAAKFPVLLFRNGTNMGPGFSRNRGIDAASGSGVLFLDADDVLGRNQLLALRDTLDGADVAWCPTLILRGSRVDISSPGDFRSAFLAGGGMPVHSMLIRRDRLPEFDLSYEYEDRGWLLRMFLSGSRFVRTDRTLCLYMPGGMKERYRNFGENCIRIRRVLRNWLLSPDGGQKDEARTYEFACANFSGSIREFVNFRNCWNLEAMRNLLDSAKLMKGLVRFRRGKRNESQWILTALLMWRRSARKVPEIESVFRAYTEFLEMSHEEIDAAIFDAYMETCVPKEILCETARKEFGPQMAEQVVSAYQLAPHTRLKFPRITIDAEKLFSETHASRSGLRAEA